MEHRDDQNNQPQRKIFTRKQEDLELKKRLLSSPELFITPKETDEGLDKLSLKLKLGIEDKFVLENYVVDEYVEYEYKFKKYWYYALADLYKVDRSVMDKYVKPKFVPMFKIHFIYARFPQTLLQSLRKKSPFIFPGYSGLRTSKLYNHLSKDASDKVDIVIQQAFDVMEQSTSVLDFKEKYSSLYKVYYQVDLFPEEYN